MKIHQKEIKNLSLMQLPESGDAGTTKGNDSTPPTPRTVKLRSLADLRKFAAIVVNKMLRGEMPEGEGRAYGYLLQIMSGLIQNSDLEARITALEKRGKHELENQIGKIRGH